MVYKRPSPNSVNLSRLQDAHRSELEDYIRQVSARAYAARVGECMPVLLGLYDSEERMQATLRKASACFSKSTCMSRSNRYWLRSWAALASAAAPIASASSRSDHPRHRERQKDVCLGFPASLFVRINNLLPGFVDNALRKQNRIMREFTHSS